METYHPPMFMKQEMDEALPHPELHAPPLSSLSSYSIPIMPDKPIHINDIPYIAPPPTTGRLLCDLCGFRTNEKTHLRQHIGHRHLPRDVPCPDCGKMMNDTIMDHHQRIHKKDHICEKCGKILI